MQTLKTVWSTIKKVLWFMWRHAVSILNAYIGMTEFIGYGSINVKNGLILIFSAAVLDCIKMKIKIQSNPFFHRPSDIQQPLHVQNYWNSSIVGSTSYLSSIGSSSHYH